MNISQDPAPGNTSVGDITVNISQGPDPSATPAECFGELPLRAFAYACTDCTGATKPLAGLEITVTTPDGHLVDCLHTEDDGTARSQNVLVGRQYKVSAATLPGYQPQADRTITLQQPQAEIALGFVPEPATLKLSAYLDLEHCEDPQGQERIAALLEISQGGQPMACVSTSTTGLAEVPITCPGLVTIVPRAAVIGGRKVRARSPEIAVYVGPGETLALQPIAFVPALGEILVVAFVVQELDGQGQRLPLPASFDLYTGSSALGSPIRTLETHGPVPGNFTELTEGYYTIVARAPSTFQGTTIEPEEPHGSTRTVYLGAGQSPDAVHEFLFKPCLGRVAGMVVDGTCGEGLAEVRVVLYAADGTGQPQATTSGPGGAFFFSQLAPNKKYVVELAQTKFALDGTTWEVPDGTTTREVTVTASKTASVSQFVLVPEETGVFGVVRTTRGEPVPHAVLDIYDENGTLYRTVVANAQAQYRCPVPRTGTYFVAVRSKTGTPAPPEQRLPVSVNSWGEANLTVVDTAFGTPPPAVPNGELREAVVDLAAYPILTESINAPAAPSTGTPVAGPTMPLGQIVDTTLRAVLAWRPKTNDPKGFVAALNQAFTLREVEGHTEWSWTPRSYAVQADLGAVTGAQASIYTRAKAALDQSLPLLEGLYALRADADPQDTDASRAIVHSQLTELVNELGIQGGPRVQRVNSLFDLLLGAGSPDPIPTDLVEVRGQLGDLRDLFGFERRRVNTVEEEQDLTNFLILVDHVASLRQNWIAQRRFFDRGSTAEPFFGTQVVLISRALAVVAESVQEVYLAMDSVFMDGAERQTTELRFASQPPLFVSELLEWIDRFASEEAPRLVQDGGKSGVIAFRPILTRLRQLARGALLTTHGGEQNPARLPAGYRTARVQRAIEEVADHLDETATLANQIQRDGTR